MVLISVIGTLRPITEPPKLPIQLAYVSFEETNGLTRKRALVFNLLQLVIISCTTDWEHLNCGSFILALQFPGLNLKIKSLSVFWPEMTSQAWR